MPYTPDTSPIVTRRALPADFPRVEAGHLATHAEHAVREPDFGEEVPFIAPYLRAIPRWRRMLPKVTHPRMTLWVAERQGALVGHLAATRTRVNGKRALQIADITVYDGYRGQRAGRSLVQTVEMEAWRQGLPMVAALIWPGNAPSQAFFSALGYTLGPYRLPDRDLTLIGALKERP